MSAFRFNCFFWKKKSNLCLLPLFESFFLRFYLILVSKELKHKKIFYKFPMTILISFLRKIFCIKLQCIVTDETNILSTVPDTSVTGSRLNPTVWISSRMKQSTLHVAIVLDMCTMQRPLDFPYVLIRFQSEHSILIHSQNNFTDWRNYINI